MDPAMITLYIGLMVGFALGWVTGFPAACWLLRDEIERIVIRRAIR